MKDGAKHFWQANPDFLLIFKGGIASLFFKACAGCVSFCLSLVVARILGMDNAGLFFLGLTVVSITATISKLGLDQVVTRHIAMAKATESWDQIRSIYRSSFFLVTVCSVATTCTVFLLSDFFAVEIFSKPALATVIRVLCWASIPFSLHWIHAQAFLGLGNIGYYHLFLRLGPGALFLLLAGLSGMSSIRPSIFNLAAFYVFCSITFLILAMLLWRSVGSNAFIEHLQAPSRIALVREAMPFLVVSLLAVITYWAGQLLLGIWGTTGEVAIYTVALQTASLLSVALVATNTAVIAKFSTLHKANNVEEIRRISIWMTRLLIFICIPVLIFLVGFSENIMNLFGEKFGSGAPILIVLLVGQSFNVATGCVGVILSASGNGRYLLVGSVTGVFVMFTLSLMLIPRHGGEGAAIAQAAALIIQNLLNSIFVKIRLGFLPLNIFSDTGRQNDG